MRQSKAIIDLQALRQNAVLAQTSAPNSKLIGVIKADAYGHGAYQAARALDAICHAYAVAFIDEAIELQDSGITKDILLLEGFFSADELNEISYRRIWTVLHHPFQIDLLNDYEGDPLQHVIIKVDTGMHRLGIMPDQLPAILEQLTKHPKIAKVSLATHFSSSDELENPVTKVQADQLLALATNYDIEITMANSAAIMGWPACHGQWNRAGIMLYGSSPYGVSQSKADKLQPVMTLTAPVIGLRDIPVGDCVGYGRNWCAYRPSKIATLAIGYADGYPRVVNTGTQVLLNGVRVPIVGNVSMDMITVDVTDLPKIDIGDTAEMWGKIININEVATAAGTIGYELLTKVTKRIPRVYIGQ